MRKTILSLISVLCGALVFTACKDDDKTGNIDHSIPLEKAVGSYADDKLAINVGGTNALILAGEKAEISGKDAGNITIAVPDYAIPGEKNLKFTGVKMTTPLFNVFEGRDSTAARVITLSGELRNGRLTLNLATRYKSAAAGVWNLRAEYDEDGMATLTPITIRTEMESELGFGSFGVQLAGLLLEKSMSLVNLNFREDGNVTATYNANTLNDMMVAMSDGTIQPVFVKTPVNAMRWYAKDNVLYLIPNLNLMFKNNPTKAAMGPLDISKIMTEGIPLYFEKDGDKMTVYVTKEQTAPIFAMLSSLISMIDPSFELNLGEGTSLELRTMLDLMITPICNVAAQAEQFDLCINLKQGEIPEEAPQPSPEASVAIAKGVKAVIAAQQ